MIVDLSSELKGRDAVSTLSACQRKRGFLYIDTYIHTSLGKCKVGAYTGTWANPVNKRGEEGGEERGRGPTVKEGDVETKELNLFTTDQEEGNH